MYIELWCIFHMMALTTFFKLCFQVKHNFYKKGKTKGFYCSYSTFIVFFGFFSLYFSMFSFFCTLPPNQKTHM